MFTKHTNHSKMKEMFDKKGDDMLCEHCGKEIPGNSKFCRYCGQPVIPQLLPGKDEPNKLPLILTALAVVVVAVLGIRHMTGSSQTPISPAAPSAVEAAVSTDTASKISTPRPSEYKKEMAALRPQIDYFARQMIQNELSNPDSLKLTHNWKALTNRGIFITHSGTANYLNRNNVQTSQSFEATVVLSENGNNAFYMALTLGDTVLYDGCDDLDEAGNIVASNTTYGDRGYGQPVFDKIINPDLWDKGPEAATDTQQELTLADYQAIDTGMTYDQVCKILGGTGVELSRTGSGQNEIFSVVWSSPDAFGAKISVTFVDGKVNAKMQLGLQ